VTDTVRQALAEFNRGAALLEQYEYSDAIEAFQAVVDTAPDWAAARFNLGIAHFNLQGKRSVEGKGGEEDPAHFDLARTAFEQILDRDPDHLHARFCLGLYHQHSGNSPKALECFEAVYRRDREDPFVAYQYASALISLNQSERMLAQQAKRLKQQEKALEHEEKASQHRRKAIEILEGVVERDPGFVSGVYKLAMQYNFTGRRAEGKALMERFKALDAVELTAEPLKADIIYGTSGKYYMALGADNLPLPPREITPTRRVVFSPETKRDGGSVNLPGIAAGDLDGDDDLDLCLTGLGEEGGTSVWFNDGSGGFAAGPMLTDRGVSPCLADVDNDGDLDLWLGRAGTDLLMQNDGKGAFYWNLPIELLSEASSVEGPDAGAEARGTAGTAPAGPARLTSCARLADVDSDGDVDLLAFRLAGGSVPVTGDAAAGASGIYNNNRDGTFADLAAELGLALADTPVAAVVYDDFDNDRDVDFVVFSAAGGAIGWVNDRVGQYRILEAETLGMAPERVISATSGDPDKDGDRDLLVFTAAGVELYVNQGGFRFEGHEAFRNHCGRLGGTGGQFADMDNDGDTDVVIADARRPDGTRGPALLVNDWPRDGFLDVLELDPGNLFAAIQFNADASCVAADFTGNGRCDVFLAPAGGQPLLIENVTPGGHWIAVDLRGTRPRDGKSLSNNSGVGARVEIKTGQVIQQFVVGTPSGPVAAPPLRVHAGLGENPRLEWLRIVWPDGVFQAEVEVPGDQLTTVVELQRKGSSCPHLFAWNGSRFEFVSAFGGVGGLGYFLEPGTYAAPDPTEYLPLPRLVPIEGQYVLQVLEPLEEVVYFDAARLIAVDHPADTQILPNEMAAVGAAPPEFEIFCFGEPIDPIQAVDHRGEEVTEEVCRVDRRYAGATEPDRRFRGFAADHFVDLDFGERLDDVDPSSRRILCLNGWVQYAYSSTNFAAGQAGLRLEAPSIHVLREGEWVELFHEVGYPAGLRHTMTLDLSGKLRPGDRKIRISSNMEICWDRIFLAVHRTDAPLELAEASASSADLHFFGYPREYSPDGRRPNLYDYENVDRAVPWKLMEGHYTRYGEVGELLDAADDCYVIMGRGEEVTLRFPADAFAPLAEGRRRTFLLEADSFCKDMNLYTAHPDTVAPLPFHAMSGYPYGPNEHYPDNDQTSQYRRRFNTRRVHVR
jgi:tetratricopeptide (TPR) repeat protein